MRLAMVRPVFIIYCAAAILPGVQAREPRMKKQTTFPLTAHEKREVEQARTAFAKALTDAGAAHVVPMLTVEFVKTMPVTERAASYVLTITANDKCREDRNDPAVLALHSALLHGRDRLDMTIEDDPVRLRHAFSASIDLHTPKVAQVLRQVRVPKL